MKIFIKYLKIALIISAFFSCKNTTSTEEVGDPGHIYAKYYDYPAWHPDGEWIAVGHMDSVDTNNDGKKDDIGDGIWLVSAVTGEKKHLINDFGYPAWRPDGKALVIGRSGQIYTISIPSLEPLQIDSSSIRQLTYEGSNFFPAWSPDGKKIVSTGTLDTEVYEGEPYMVGKILSDE